MANGEKPKKSNVLLWVVLGCGGALVLVAILAVIAAIAIPVAVRARPVSNEINAVGAMRSYIVAQTMFHRNDWDGSGTVGVLEYASDYRLLNTQKDGNGDQIDLIDSAFAAAKGPNGVPQRGYIFREMKTIGGKKIDWVSDYALCAIPAQYGKTGVRTFIVTTDGTIFGKDQGPGGSFVDDYPQDLMAAGWIIAE